MKKIISIILLLMLVSIFTFQSASAVLVNNSMMRITIPNSYIETSNETLTAEDNIYSYKDIETGRSVSIKYTDNSEKINLKKINKENYKASLVEQLNNAFSIDGTVIYNNSTVTDVNINQLDMIYITTSQQLPDTNKTIYIDAYIFTSVNSICYIMTCSYKGRNPDTASIINSIELKDEKFADTMIGSLLQGTLSEKEKNTLGHIMLSMIIIAIIIIHIIPIIRFVKLHGITISQDTTSDESILSKIPFRSIIYLIIQSIGRYIFYRR